MPCSPTNHPAPATEWLKRQRELQAVQPNRDQPLSHPMSAMDNHDLKALLTFWEAELKLLETYTKDPNTWPLPQDVALAKAKAETYRGELARRNLAGEM